MNSLQQRDMALVDLLVGRYGKKKVLASLDEIERKSKEK